MPGGGYRYYRDPDARARDYERAMDELFDDLRRRAAARRRVGRGELPAATTSPARTPRGPGQGAGPPARPAARRRRCRTWASTPAARPTSSSSCTCWPTRCPRRARYGRMILEAVQAVMPSFVARVERPDRGGEWIAYLRGPRARRRPLGARASGLDRERRAPRRAPVGAPAARRRRRGRAAGRAALRGRRRRRGGHAHPPGRALGATSARELLSRPRRRARQPPPPPRPRLRGAALPLRDRLGLRRLPRPPAPPDAHRPVAAPDARTSAPACPRRSRPPAAATLYRRALDVSRGRVGAPGRRGPRARGALRALPRLPHPLRARPQRARGDAAHRAALRARGPPELPRGRARDAPPDRRRSTPPSPAR